jgi:uncharacterized membrane protein YhaH (DUF805 family)
MTNGAPSGRAWGSGVWVAIVALVGLVAGFVLGITVPAAVPPARPPCAAGPGCPAPPRATSPAALLGYPHLAVLLAVLALTALVALLAVYARTYRETRSPQILGLVVFLVALALEAVLTSPFVFARFAAVPQGLDPFLLAGQVFEDVALLVFLYLSLL